MPSVAFCDDGNEEVETPYSLTLTLGNTAAAPMNPAPVLEQLPLVPVLEQLPLVCDQIRELGLRQFCSLKNWGQNDIKLQEMLIAKLQIIEKSVEIALLEDGLPRIILFRKLHELRAFMHCNSNGEMFKIATYNAYIAKIEQYSVRRTMPYTRVVNAIQANDIIINLIYR